MEKRRRISRLHFLILLTFLCSAPGIYATTTWVGLVTGDVIDQDLILDASGGSIILQLGATLINAATVDVNVTLVNGDVTVEGAGDGPSCLYLVASSGHKITFNITGGDDLTFLGSSDVALDPLVIFVEGEVDIQMTGNRTFTLGSDGTHGGTQCYVIMQAAPESMLAFIRTDTIASDENFDANINIDANSVLSYAALVNDTTSDATISFCPTNGGTGRMVLNIADMGSHVIQGHLLSTRIEDECQTVDRTTPSGRHAIWSIIQGVACVDAFDGPNPPTFLTVANSNATFPELLIDPFFSQDARSGPPFIGSFNGLRFGFILGANGTINVSSGTYLDYVGLSTNVCPPITTIEGVIPDNDDDIDTTCPCDDSVGAILKERNPSALIIDGWLATPINPALITLGTQSGIFFRSGVDSSGVVENPTDPFIYTIDPANMTPGIGEIVFDVEGPLEVTGQNISGINSIDVYNSRMEILSLHVLSSGGPLFPDPGSTGTTFPLRDFATDGNGALRQYNKAAWLINNVATVTTEPQFISGMELINTSIGHTDELHKVCQSNDSISEATYVGGEGWFISQLRGDSPEIARPNIEFINSRLHLYTSAAFTGFDLLVPDNVIDVGIIPTEFPNLVKFIFYSNGRVIDNGTGRTMILGTLIGSQACDGCTVISRDTHLDVLQTADFTAVDGSVTPGQDQQLWFTTSINTNLTIQAIGSTNITGQFSIHEIFLGGNSNNSIGEPAAPTCESVFTLQSAPTELIAGNFFNFSTHGGSVGIPETSNVTGQGGIFVDLNGTFGIMPNFRASISTMVTKSCNGAINLPKSQVVFDNRVGIANWNLVLSSPEKVIVQPTDVFSDYTLNWVATTKDFVDFTPYELGSVSICGCPAVVQANVTSLPTIQGLVEQLQIVDSRIGDAAHVLIDGGYVREVLWLSNCRPAEAATAVLVIQNGGRLGLNSANRNVDSINTETTLGVNGIMLIANGNGRVDLNSDVIINNICPLLQGPSWIASNVLEFRADASRAIHVTKNGVLDLRSFTVGGIIRIGENIRLIMEPGATLILGGAALELNENASIEFEASPQAAQFFLNLDTTVGPINNALPPLTSRSITAPHNEFSPLTGYGTGLHNTDGFRSHIVGVGTLRLRDKAQAFTGVGAVVGLETLFNVLPNLTVCQIPTTNMTLELDEGSSWQIGFGNNDEGGSFQIGNVQNNGEGHNITFNLNLNGPDATFIMGAGAFFGLGAGVVRPTAHDEPQTKGLTDTLFNVLAVNFNFFQGSFQVERIFNSDDSRSHSLVIGSVGSFNIAYAGQGDDPAVLDTNNFGIYGGGNLFLLVPGTQLLNNIGAIALINRTSDDVIQIPVTGGPAVQDVRLHAGIVASTDMLDNLNVSGLSPLVFFQTIKALSTTNVVSRSQGYATIAPEDLVAFRESRTIARVGYVDRGFIGRVNISDIVDSNGASQGDRRARAYDLGTVAVSVNVAFAAPAPILTATQIQVS